MKDSKLPLHNVHHKPMKCKKKKIKNQATWSTNENFTTGQRDFPAGKSECVVQITDKEPDSIQIDLFPFAYSPTSGSPAKKCAQKLYLNLFCCILFHAFQKNGCFFHFQGIYYFCFQVASWNIENQKRKWKYEKIQNFTSAGDTNAVWCLQSKCFMPQRCAWYLPQTNASYGGVMPHSISVHADRAIGE